MVLFIFLRGALPAVLGTIGAKSSDVPGPVHVKYVLAP